MEQGSLSLQAPSSQTAPLWLVRELTGVPGAGHTLHQHTSPLEGILQTHRIQGNVPHKTSALAEPQSLYLSNGGVCDYISLCQNYLIMCMAVPLLLGGSGMHLVLSVAVSPMSSSGPGTQKAPSICRINHCSQVSAQKLMLWCFLASTSRSGCPRGGGQDVLQFRPQMSLDEAGVFPRGAGQFPLESVFHSSILTFAENLVQRH